MTGPTPAAPRPRRPAAPAPALRLPAYALYGEAQAAAAEPLHCESIAERSRLHGWEIRPHRHATLFQLLVVQAGGAQALLEGEPLALQGPVLLTVPALAAHGFRFTPDIDGLVFTIAQAHLTALLQPHAGLAEALLHARGQALPAGPAGAAVLAAAAALSEEARAAGPWRGAALDAALLRLLVAVARCAPASAAVAAVPPPRALAHVQRLQALVEAQFRQQPSQAALAAQLGITSTQLNRACRQVLGRPALAVLHARLLLQAQRELAYTHLGIKQIAFELGFVDAAYFTRFFRRGAGCAPSAWRAARQGAAAAQVLRGGARKQA